MIGKWEPRIAFIVVSNLCRLANAGLTRYCCLVLANTLISSCIVVIATTGQMGVFPGHVATIAEGFFLSLRGMKLPSISFAFDTPDSVTDIVAVGHIDPSLVQKALAYFTQKRLKPRMLLMFIVH